jgi:hypothetical protein
MDHTPIHNPADPAEPPDDPMIDQVPGVPPVPITVWRTPSNDTHTSMSPRLAYRLVAAYSAPGDIIIDLTGTDSIAEVAATGHRIHLRAAFGAARLTISAAAPPAGASTPTGTAARRGVEAAEPSDWFGDDLHTPTNPDTGALHGGPVADGRPSLIVAPWPLDQREAGNATRLGVLVATATRILRPGGCLIFSTRQPAADFTALVDAGHTVGLRYLQHIIAISADIDGDHFVYYADGRDLDHPDPPRHTRIHTDLIVFTTTSGRSDGGTHD